MNAKSTATGTTAAIVPGAIIVGVGLLVSSIAGLQAQRNQYRAEAASPRPTATVTAPPAVRPGPASTTAVVTVTPTPATVVPVSDRAGMPHTSSGYLSHTQARPPSTPRPTPTASSPAASPARLGVRASASVHINPTGGTGGTR